MKKRKGNLLHRMMALLLSAVLTAGTVLGTAPLNVLAQENAGEGYNQAQESVSGNAVTEEETGAESDGEEMETDPAEGDSEEAGAPEETNPPVENLVTEEPGGEAEQKPSAEDEGAGTIGETDGQPDEAAAPQKVMRTAGVAAQADGDVSGDGWVLDADGTLTIESDAGMSDWVSYKTDNLWDVIECVTKVNILPDVTNIGESAFSDCYLKTITIPASVTNIGESAFSDCYNLTTITIPASVESIGAEALAGCDSLDRVIMQGSTPPTLGTYENKGAHFEGCGFVTDNLKGIKVPEGTTAVYKAAWPEWAAYITDGSASEVETIASGTGWTFDSNGKLTIESDEGLAAWKKDGYSANKKKIRTVELLERVTKIVFNSFGECSRLAAITIPSSVTEIERYTFPGDALTNITIPAGVTSIGESAFMNCGGLESVTVLGEDPATIGSGIFEGCKFVTDKAKGIKVPAGTADAYKAAWTDWADYITDGMEDFVAFGTDWTLDADGKLTIKSDAGMTDWCSLRESSGHPYKTNVKTAEIQDGVTSIQQSAFYSFSSLEEITIPNSVKEIGNFAFVSCSSLASITIPDGVTSIGERAFDRCSSLTSITIPNSVTSIGEEAFRECSGLTSINLSNQVTSIGELVFAECKALTSITIPDGMTSIGESMFDQCSGLESITIPDSVTSIGDRAFYECSALTDITIPDSVTSIGVQAFDNCSGLTSIVLPPQVTSIAPGLFRRCSNLEEITLPDGVTSIGEEAFYECSALTSITLPNSVTDIGMMYTFAFCSSLTSITIPDNVTEIGLGTFYGCSNLKNITIPSNVTDIGCIAFSECTSLESVTMQGSTPPTLDIMDEETGETGVFASCKFVTDNEKGIKVPAGTAEAYTTAWPEWADYITDGTEDLLAFGTDWTLDADGKLTIESDAGMTAWCSQSKYFNQVISVEIKDGVTRIGASAFVNCSALTGITIPDSVISIESNAFNCCSALTSIVLPPKVTSIESRLFHGCSKLEEITIPDGVTSIGEGAFEGCSALESITIPDGVTGIGDYAFWCSGLTSVTIPDTITNIGSFSFSGCSKLEEITIPDGVTDIGQGAFFQCIGLVSVTMKGSTPPTLVDNVFTQCKFVTENMKGIKVPEGTAGLYKTEWTEWADYIEGYSTPEEKVEAAKNAAEEALKEITVSNATTEENLQEAIEEAVKAALEEAGVDSEGITISVGEFTKKDATEDEEGSISAIVTITSGEEPDTVTDTVTVDKTIDKLPGTPATPAEKVQAAKEAAEEALAEITVSNATTGESLQEAIEEAVKAALEEAGVDSTDITVTVKDFTKKDATEDEAGSIIATVTITSGEGSETATGTVTVDKTIDKLPGTPATPAEKVQAAKEAAEEALAEITVSNATTGESLQEAIEEAVNAALQEAGMDSTDVTVTVKGFTSTPATAGTEGKISATVEISSGEGSDKVTETVTVDKTIDKLPSTPAEKVEAAKKAAEDALEEITVSNDTTKESLQDDIEEAVKAALEEAGVDSTDITVTVKDFTSTPATAGTEGKISATVEITSGGGSETAAGTVTVDKTIDKLPATPATPAEKVEAAKEAVEEALKEITLSNATTEERLQRDIEKAVNDALEKAGMDSSDVTVSVEDFTKTDATLDAEGSISATVKISSGEGSDKVTESVTVDQTIRKLPGTPGEKVSAVKEAVEDALRDAIEKMLAGTEVTNENREETAEKIAELIPGAVEEALEASGVSMNDVGFDFDVNADDLATVDKEGNIRVAILVASTEDSGVSAAAEVLVPIAKPDKDEVWANEVVEGALTEDITITNETTRDEILDVIKEALGDGATVEDMEEVERVDATQDAPGKLSLRIRLTINGKTVYITVNVPIAQLTSREGVYVRFLDYDSMGEDSRPCYKYTGTAVKPAIEVYNNETLLTQGSDYTVVYKDNVKAGGDSRLYIKGKGSFSGRSRMVNFTIINADIGRDTDHPTEMTVVAKTKVAPVIMDGTRKLTAKDYKLEGEGLKNGKYTNATAEGTPNILTVTGIGGYAGSSFEIKVTVIEKSAAKKLAVNVDKNFKPVYNGSALNLSALFKQTQDGEGAVTVTDSKDKTKILKEGTDFNVICTSSLSNAGTVKFTLTGMGEYTGSVSKTFKISPLKVTDSAKFSVTFDEDKDYEYKASGASVDNLVVKYLGETDSDTDDKILIPGVDYKVTYSNHKKVSTKKDAGFKITFLGNYKGSSAVSRTFKVVTAKLSAANTAVTVPDKVYGKANTAYKSAPIVTVNGAAIKASNYTVSYAWATESEAGDDTKYVSDNKVKITIADGDAYAKVKVTVTPKQTGSYGLAEGAVIEGEYYVRRKPAEAFNLSKATVIFSDKAGKTLTSLEYNGRPFYTPEGNDPDAEDAPDSANAVYVRVRIGGQVVDPGLYDVVWTNATAKGKATVVIRGKGTATENGMAVGSKNKSINIKAMSLTYQALKNYAENAVKSLKNIFSRIQ